MLEQVLCHLVDLMVFYFIAAVHIHIYSLYKYCVCHYFGGIYI